MPQSITRLIKLAGGHPYLLKLLIKSASQSQSYSNLIHHPAIKNLFDQLYNSLCRKTQLQLGAALISPRLTPESSYLLQTKLWQGQTVFSPLWRDYLFEFAWSTLPLEKKDSLLLFNQPIELFLSPTERNILRLLYQNQGQVVNRDQLAQTIWGKRWTSLYSDWAIDQHLSRLRRKLGPFGSYIVAVKRKGVKLLLNPSSERS